ncbi:MAG: response regulator, partial [Candidatus Pacebacteria bacterium]|nr:response regulator [Candidatus Paceibacterota bacterium]
QCHNCAIIKSMPEDAKRIMIVEDDRFLSFLMKARLEKDGFVVSQVFDGEEAIQLLKTETPSLIILDLIMPKVTGFEVLKTISLTPKLAAIPVVIVSNLAQDSDIEKARELGAKEYFVKVKVSIDDLVQRIKALVV